jgi:hypothetical protein
VNRATTQVLSDQINFVLLTFSLLFLAKVRCPFEPARISSEVQGAFSAFARTEPQNRAIILDIHHACACREIVATERTFSRFGQS